jgi:transposase
LTTKIHAIVDALGNPLAVSLTGGHVHDVTQAQVLTQEIEPAALLADKQRIAMALSRCASYQSCRPSAKTRS